MAWTRKPGNVGRPEDVQRFYHDPVNHPSHYTFGTIEVIDVLEDWDLEFHEGNALKYIARAKHKGNRIQDLEKAVFYLNRKVALLKKKEKGHGVRKGSSLRRVPKG